MPYFEIESIPIILGSLQGTLYLPKDKKNRSSVAVATNYIMLMQGAELARRGFVTLTMPANRSAQNPDEGFCDIDRAVRYLRGIEGIKKVVGLSWSGGCTTLSAYQAIAENGQEIFQGENMLIKLSDVGKLDPMDGVIFLDSNWGNGSMTLLSLDPCVTDEKDGNHLDLTLDLFDEKNGYAPAGSTYSKAFIAAFQRAQGKRMNRIVDHAAERNRLIDAGKGYYIDDEPLIIPGGEQFAPHNKLFPQDIRLLSHTQDAYELLHGDGSVTHKVIYSVRPARGGKIETRKYFGGARVTTVKQFLRMAAVKVSSDYYYDSDTMHGIEWENTYTCTPGNVSHITAPALVMGMTGSYEFLAAETIFRNLKSADKQIAFVHGADHIFTPNKRAEKFEGEFGDTVKVLFDRVAKWLCERE